MGKNSENAPELKKTVLILHLAAESYMLVSSEQSTRLPACGGAMEWDPWPFENI